MRVKLKDGAIDVYQFTGSPESIVEVSEILKQVGAPVVVGYSDKLVIPISAEQKFEMLVGMWLINWNVQRKWAICTDEQYKAVFDGRSSEVSEAAHRTPDDT